MQLFEQILSCYGWEGAALAGATLLMLGVQLYYYIFVYGRIPGYKNNRRPQTMDREPPVSVVVPLFSEDYSFVEERLPLILAQNYPDFEVVIVYVGHDSDFYEDLVRLKQSFPQITTTKIHLDPRFPISRKMALNVGIKSAHYECMVFTSTDAVPQTDRWLSLMAKGFMRGEIVVGYCGVERGKGFSNYMMRAWRMMHSADWIARAVQRRAYRGTLHNYGFTKSLYFGANGFSHLNMNIGEDDLFMQRVMTRDNVSVILSPRASLREKMWGGMGWWTSQLRYFGSAFRFYPRAVKTFVRWEIGSRVLFFATVVCALAVMPPEYKLAALLLAVIRYVVVAFEVRRIARRLGEGGIAGRYFIYDLLGPLWEIADYIVAEDRELVDRVLKGDNDAFEYLFNRYRDAIHRLFVQRLGGVNDADDLLQETFIKVYINLHRYSADYTFGQWVYTIARNTFIDFVRRRQDDLPIDERFAAPALNAPTPEESVINLQQRSQIEHYLEHLAPRYRQLILMRFFEEYSYEEIAAKLSLPLGTVKTQIHRAREQMCRLIAQGDER